MTNKKGFTLVEIMVVVIIMGVLAAVGVPKLFGVIAKAKAAEVPVAAGTYISLQNTYLHENNGIGSWQNIGYGAPGNGQSEYFKYSGCIQGNIPFSAMEPEMPGWMAFNLTKLNSCKSNSAWIIVIDPAGEREISYQRLVSSEDCAALTSNWDLGTATEGMCEATAELHNVTPEDPEPGEPPEGDEPETQSSSSESQPQTSASNEQSSSSQGGDCDALAKSIKNDHGNKFGWVCVSECGMFAPPGKARNSGFTGSYQKKKNSPTCEKVEPQNNSGNNEQGNNEENQSGDTQNIPANGDQTQTDGDGEVTNNSEDKPSGDGNETIIVTDPENNNVTNLGGNEEEEEELPEEVTPEDYPDFFESLPNTLCKEWNPGLGTCKNKKDVDKSKCVKYNRKKQICTATK